MWFCSEVGPLHQAVGGTFGFQSQWPLCFISIISLTKKCTFVNATKQSGQTMSQQPNLLFLSYASSEAVEMSEAPNFREQPRFECL